MQKYLLLSLVFLTNSFLSFGQFNLNELTDFAIYNSNGQRLGVYRNKRQADVSNLTPGNYYIQVANKGTVKFVVQ